MANLIALENGTELVGDYRIERVLGAGGFGITYLATEMALNRQVTIKEYFPSDFAVRRDRIDAVPRSQGCEGDYQWGLDRFIEEAQALAKFNHPNIVRVYRYFRANSTGYMVLHFEEGLSLKAWLKSLGRAPRQKELDAIVAPLLDALDLIHKADFLHRDIAPDNIIIRKNGEPVLIDFGSARREIASHSKTVSALVKPGYSPYEQYAETSRQQGPWTDIYALGATLYHAVAGKRPMDSPSRMVKDELTPAREAALGAYRLQFLKAIDHALALSVESRPQSVAAWRGGLLAPEPEKQGWISRTFPKNVAREDVRAATPALAGSHTVPLPPPPDVPGAEGSLNEFFAGLRKKQERKSPAKAEAILAPVAVAPEVLPALAPDPEPQPAKPARPAKTEKLETSLPPARLPRIFRSKEPAKKPTAAAGAAPKGDSKEKRKASRPRPVRLGRTTSWQPLLFKLAVGVGVASGAVAMQDKLPRFESRGSGTTSATFRPAAIEAPRVAPLAELRGHVGPVNAVVYADGGRYIVSAGQDARLKVWDSSRSTLLRTIELDDGPPTALATFATRVLTGHAGGEIVLWDIETAEKIATFKRNEAEVWSLTFAGRPDRFAASSHDWKVALWDTANTSGPVHVMDAHKSAVQAVAYGLSPKGPLLASGGADKNVMLWNLDTLDRPRTYRGHRDFVTALAFSPSGKSLASSSLDGSIRVWSVSSTRLQRRLYGHRGRVGGLAFSPAGDTLASAGADGQLRLWDVERGRTLKTILGHAGAINAVSFSPDGERIASAGEDGIVRIWANPVTHAVTN